MGSTSEKHRAMIRMLQHSILQLCNEQVGYSHKLQILGVLCMTIDDESQEVVIKVNNTLKRVPTSNNSRDSAPSVAPAPIPIPGHSITQTQSQPINAQQFTSPKAGAMGMFPSAAAPNRSSASTPIASPAFIVSPSGLITQPQAALLNSINMNAIAANANDFIQNNNNKEKKSANTPRPGCITPVSSSQSSSLNTSNAQDLSISPRVANASSASSVTPTHSPAKKSVGRKARKPMRVDCVYDEGEMIMNEDNDFLTVLPTDPDNLDVEEARPIIQEKTNSPKPAVNSERSASQTPEPGSSQLSIMRQVLEKGAAAAAMNLGGATPDASTISQASQFFDAQRSLLTSLATSVPSQAGIQGGSASIRALLQAQAQMRQQAKITNSSTVKTNGLGYRSNTGSPHTDPSMITPILVTPESPSCGSERAANGSLLNSSDVTPGSIDHEQEEALDFSNADKDSHLMNSDDDGDIEIVRSANTSTPFSNADSSLVQVKDEPKDSLNSSRCASRVSEPTAPEDLSQNVALSSGGASAIGQTMPIAPSHSAFPSPYATYAFVDGLQGMPQFAAYSGLNLSMSGGGLSSMNGSDGGLSIQYTPTGPITVGANGQNMSHPPTKVRDMLGIYDSSPSKKPKLSTLNNKVDREGNYMLDHLGEEARKRRRRSPNETFTVEEIAEYMGASNVPSGRDGGVMFKCKYCSEEIDDLVRYLQHTLTVHNAYICHQCGKSFTTKSSLLRHRPIHTGLRRFACSICKKSFYRKDKCKSHIKRHLGPNDQNVDQYQHIEPVPEMGENMIMTMS